MSTDKPKTPPPTSGGTDKLDREAALKYLQSCAASARAATSVTGADSLVQASDKQPAVNSATAPNEGTQPKKKKSHYFSQPFAKAHGVAEAIVVKFIAHKVRQAEKLKSKKTFQDGKYWFYDSISRLAERFPYIARSTLADLLKRLKDKTKGLIQVGNFNRCRYDDTVWYTVPQQVMDEAEKGPLIRVDLDVANTHGICVAVLMAHIRYELLEKPKKKKGKKSQFWPYVSMSPTALAKLLPFSAKTIKRTLVTLVKAGLIVENPAKKLFYTLPELINTKGTNPDDNRPKPDGTGTNPDRKWTEPDEKWTNPDNYTHCKPLEAIGNTIRNPFKKEPQAAPGGVIESSQEVKSENQADQQDFWIHEGEQLTYEQLNDINKKNSPMFDFKDPKLGQWDQPANDPGMMARSMVLQFSFQFVCDLSVDTILSLLKITDVDQLMAEVKTLFTTYFKSKAPTAATLVAMDFGAFKHIFFHASLEFIVAAIANQHGYYNKSDKPRLYHSIENLVCRIPDLEQEMFGRINKHNTEAWQQWMEDRKKQYASVDQDKESDISLAPAEKARVLRNALQSRQQIGYLDCMCSHKELPVIFSNDDLAKAERLFELNRGFSVAQLLQVIDRCVYSHINDAKTDGFDERFHARRGHRLSYFLRFAVKIAQELNMTDLNGWASLPEDIDNEPEEAEEAPTSAVRQAENNEPSKEASVSPIAMPVAPHSEAVSGKSLKDYLETEFNGTPKS